VNGDKRDGLDVNVTRQTEVFYDQNQRRIRTEVYSDIGKNGLAMTKTVTEGGTTTVYKLDPRTNKWVLKNRYDQLSSSDALSQPMPPIERDPKPNPANPSPIVGKWNGWGGVEITGQNGIYKGTYQDTFSGRPGTLEIKKTGNSTFEGTWGESEKRHGTFRLTLSAGGKTLWVSWKASDDNIERNETWTRP